MTTGWSENFVAGDPQTKPLFHYTDAVGFSGIVQERVIRATHFEFLNDSEETRLGERTIKNALEWLAQHEGGPAARLASRLCDDWHTALTDVADVYVASFCEDGDTLSQWRAYAQDGAGYSI